MVLGKHRLDLLVILDEGKGRVGREERQRVALDGVAQLPIRTGEHHLPVQIDFEPLKPARSVVMVLRLLYSLPLRPEIGR